MNRSRTLLVFLAFLPSALSGSAFAGDTSGPKNIPPGRDLPVNSALPSITGSMTVGQTLTATAGSWSGPTVSSISYQWGHCDSSGGACAPIAGTTSNSYGLGAGDVGTTLVVTVTASNKNGSSVASSAPTQVVAPPPVQSSTPPPPSPSPSPSPPPPSPSPSPSPPPPSPSPSPQPAPTQPVGVDVAGFGAVGDGTHDDTAALQAAFKSGQSTYSSPGKTFRVTNSLYLYGSTNFQGSTIQFVGGSPTNYIGLAPATATAVIANATIDGTGRSGSYVRGINVDNGFALTATAVSTRDTKGDGLGMGFRVGAGTLICSTCDAQGADLAGFYVAVEANAATSISGTSSHNATGLQVNGHAGGAIPSFTSNDDNAFGVLFDNGGSNWIVGTINASNEGTTLHNQAATGVELWNGNSHNRFGTITTNANPGYGLAIAGGSTYNTVDVFNGDGAGSWDSDPGLVFTGGASYNTINRATVKNYSVGLHIGEDNTTPNDGNHVGVLYVQNAGWCGIRIEYGSNNRVDTATLVNDGTSSTPAGYFPGDVDFANNVNGNSIGSLNQSGTTVRPTYGIHFAVGANGNSIEAGSVTSYQSAKVVDQNGGNKAAVN